MTEACLTPEAVLNAVLAEVIASRAEVVALRHEVGELRAALVAAPTARDERLLNEVATHAREGEEFTAAQIVAIAETDSDLRLALAEVVGCGKGQARRLGKAFERFTRHEVGDYRLRRVGETREGAAWAFLRE